MIAVPGLQNRVNEEIHGWIVEGLIGFDRRIVVGWLKPGRGIHSRRSLIDELGVAQVGIGKLPQQLSQHDLFKCAK